MPDETNTQTTTGLQMDDLQSAVQDGQIAENNNAPASQPTPTPDAASEINNQPAASDTSPVSDNADSASPPNTLNQADASSSGQEAETISTEPNNSTPNTVVPSLSIDEIAAAQTAVNVGNAQTLPENSQAVNVGATLLQRARAAIFGRKQKKLEKILALARTKPSISNDDVEKLLRVSDATASRYLRQLVKEGRLKQSGKVKLVRYEPVK